MRWFFLILSVLSACAHKPPSPAPPSDLLYPHGTYQHRVKVHITQPVRDVELRGVVQSSPERLKVVGLSTFNTTVFRIDENLKTGEIDKEFYVEAIRRNEDKFMFFYRLMKELTLARKGQSEFDRENAHFKLTAPDPQGIPRRIAITNEHVNLDIEVTGYEF